VPAQQHLSGPAPTRLRDRPSWLISRAYARSSGLLSKAFEADAAGLRSYHFRLLAALEEWGPASQADLGRSTGIDRSDVTAALAELETRDLILRTVDPDNKRRNIVSITKAGSKQLAGLDQIVADVQDQILAPLTPAQRTQFVTLIRRMLS
jgi:MarR family transcriptional regulator, lower aerobic nicotinate degradation pathway regulator